MKGLALPRQGIGAILAQTHPVTVAGDPKGHLRIGGGGGKMGGAEAKKTSGLTSAEADAPNSHRGHHPGIISDQVSEPIPERQNVKYRSKIN